ncbi:50S ribosomal protein L18 [Candidatus Mycoplasma haematolamae str. Purdue]|uniref:50S ribosomal protein L18 n=1 Tax=Mycoplasma haematolamae (strain Purdue) TaxID=1212765 RepID=I7C6G8_MYCHA|nr:50S ribosomal protein L18 [Candidatus Mycoplasma haematolamae str. Purdue]
MRSSETGQMLFSCSSLQLKIRKGGQKNLEKVTDSLVNKLREKKIEKLTLDRGYHSYHGTLQRVRERLLSEGIRI